MVYHVVQHIPNFVDGVEPQRGQFSTLEELQSIPFVAKWVKGEMFKRLSVSDNHLMAELNDGTEWWVIGSFDGDKPNFLPPWVSPTEH